MTSKMIIFTSAMCLMCFIVYQPELVRSFQLPQAHLAQAQTSRPDTGNTSSSKPGYSLTATPSSTLLTPYQPLVLTVSLTNISPVTVSVYDIEPDINFSLTVTGAKGVPVSLTEYGKAAQKIKETEAFGFHVQPLHISYLESGQTKTYALLLSRIYDFSMRGGYTITVQRRILSNDRKTFVDITSNRVTVTVSDPAPPADQGVE